MKYTVYIITNEYNTVLYGGMTNDIIRRIYEHKNQLAEGFSSKYKLTKLVYMETTNNVNDAIAREKQIKRWSRKKKEFLINELNPTWNDLSVD